MSARLSGDREAGFTLIELLVVMLILGILAAIAIPAFFNQRDKGTDAQAKAAVRTAQTAIETWATDNGGVYDAEGGPSAEDLEVIEPTLEDATLENPSGLGPSAYTVTVESDTETDFSISRNGGTVEFDCEPVGGGCPTGGDWSQ